MKQLSFALCAAAVLMATSPAQAYFQVIRWSTGLCETWNYDLPTRPFPWDYKVMTKPIATFEAAVKAKMDLAAKKQCTF